MTSNILRRLITAGTTAAVLFMGPAAVVVPPPPLTSAVVQVASVATAEPGRPAPAVAPEVLPPASTAAPEAAIDSVPADATAAPDPLSWITVGGTLPSAPVDPGAPYSGVVVAPKADGLAVHKAPGGQVIGLLPARVVDSDGSDRIWMPVIGEANGPWLQVLLPARRNLPSSGAPTNGATGFVFASEVLAKPSTVTVAVDLAAETITVADASTVLDVFPISISGGDETNRGRSFVMGRYATELSQACSAQPMLVLSGQSESVDGYIGQDTAVQGIHGFFDACRELSGFTQSTPGCVIVDETDMARLLALIPDGTPVTMQG